MRKNSALTRRLVLPYPDAMGRKRKWAEDMQARFPKGTFDRISEVLEQSEDRTDFVREAVERELKRRERQKPKPEPSP